jgi:hypothetical protein
MIRGKGIFTDGIKTFMSSEAIPGIHKLALFEWLSYVGLIWSVGLGIIFSPLLSWQISLLPIVGFSALSIFQSIMSYEKGGVKQSISDLSKGFIFGAFVVAGATYGSLKGT